MRALVSGGAGFIGSHLVDALLTEGAEVLVVDDLSVGSRENLEGALVAGVELVVEDITEAAAMSRVAEAFGPDRVFHMAGQIDVRRAVADPVLDASVNVGGTINLLEAARRAGATFVFASTGGAIYGERAHRGVPVAEDGECIPESPYGQSKLAAEGYVDLYRRLHEVPGVSLRLANIYGSRQSPISEAGVVAIFCGKLVADAAPTVFGDGEQTRDFLYVRDAVEAILAAERKLSASGAEPLGPYNVGTGRETSVLELIERLARLGGRSDWAPRMAPPRTGEVQRIALDSERARAELGWSPATELDEGLELTLAALTHESPA